VEFRTTESVKEEGSYEKLLNRIPSFSIFPKKARANSTYPSEVLWLLEEGMHAYIGTSNVNGKPHVTPTIFVFDGKAPYVVTSKVSRKVKNLKENRQVSLLIDVRDPTEVMNNRALLIEGNAKVFNLIDAIFHLPKIIKIRELFNRKYPHYVRKYAENRDKLPRAWRTTLFLSRVLIRIDIEKFAYWKRANRVFVPI
jgi:uncharacterized pyridoxamine 5'-phosphate oxidase family protein